MLKKKYTQISCAFFIPIAIFLLISAISKSYPFGVNSLQSETFWNTNILYIKDSLQKIKETESFVYDFSIGMGYETIYSFIYCVLNPFNLLYLMFDSIDPLSISTAIMMIQMGLASTAMWFYCHSKNPKGKIGARLILSSAYSLSGFGISIFGDGVFASSFILVPLIFQNLDMLLSRTAKPFSLLFLRDLKYHLHLSVLLLSSIVMNFQFGLATVVAAIIYSICKKAGTQNFKRNFIGVLVSSSVSCLGTLPILYLLFDMNIRQGLSFSERFENICSYFNLTFAGYSFVSVFVLMTTIIYWTNKTISKETKIRNGILISSMLALSLFFDGIINNTSFSCFLAILTFFIITIADDHIDSESFIVDKSTKIFLMITISIIIVIKGIVTGRWIPALILGVFALLYVFIYNKRTILKYVVCLELVVSAFLTANSVVPVPYILLTSANIKNNFRIGYDMNVINSENIPVQTIKNGATITAIGDSPENYELFKSLTGEENKRGISCVPFSPVYNSMIGISNIQTDYLLKAKYLAVNYSNDYNFYMYSYTKKLPVGYMVSSEINSYQGKGNVFENNNEFVRLSASIKEDLFTEITDENVKVNDRTVSFTSTKDIAGMYFYISGYGTYSNKANLSINTTEYMQNINIDSSSTVLFVGDVKQGDTITLSFADEIDSNIHIISASFNESVFNTWYETLSKNTTTTVEQGNDYFTLNIDNNAEDSMLLLSIAYNKHLHIYVDGQETDWTGVLNNALVGINIDKGVHNINIKYELDYPYLIFITSGMVFIIYILAFLATFRAKIQLLKS